MTTDLDLPNPHPPRRPYPTRSHIHTGPLVITTSPSLTESDSRLTYLRVYDRRDISSKSSPSPSSLSFKCQTMVARWSKPRRLWTSGYVRSVTWRHPHAPHFQFHHPCESNGIHTHTHTHTHTHKTSYVDNRWGICVQVNTISPPLLFHNTKQVPIRESSDVMGDIPIISRSYKLCEEVSGLRTCCTDYKKDWALLWAVLVDTPVPTLDVGLCVPPDIVHPRMTQSIIELLTV